MKINLKGADPKGLSCIEPVTYRNRYDIVDRSTVLLTYY